MKISTTLITSLAMAGAMTARADDTVDAARHGPGGSPQHAVFVMTNDADANAVIAYQRDANGQLHSPKSYRTFGRGSGGTVDPLGSQGSLTLSKRGNLLFAVNAGSGSVSTFRVHGSRLELTDLAPSGGADPNAVAQSGKLVYVLNSAGSASVVGFRIDGGNLTRIPESTRFLSANFVNSASLAFSPDGRFLVASERATNKIDVFSVLADGTLSPIKINPSASPGVFSLVFSPSGAIIASETGAGGIDDSTISSYSINGDGTLQPITTGLPTLGAANCWNVVTPDGKFVYASNAGSSSIAGFSIATSGALTALPGTIVGQNPPGSANLDIALSADGRFLYSLNGASGAIGMFQIRAQDGLLVSLGAVEGLPAAAGINGIAAN